ncbi:MAG: hypothetical protein EA425_12650, partial [Puniceicoccaceae bacterium]
MRSSDSNLPRWLRRSAGPVLALLFGCSVYADTMEPDNSVAREWSLHAGSVASSLPVTDATAREFSLFAGATIPRLAVADAASREFSIFAGPLGGAAVTDAVAREFSLLVGEAAIPVITDAVAREFSIHVPFPDLVPTAFTAPAEGLTQTTVTVSWTVKNEGSAPAAGTWTDRVHLSPDGEFSSAHPVLAAVTFTGSLGPGESYSRSAEIVLPVLAGDYSLIFVANADAQLDEAGDRANNLVAAPIAIEFGPLPDLAPSAVAGPAEARPGDSVTVTWTTTNHGDATSFGPWIEQILLSDDDVIGDDRFLTAITIPDPLAPGEAATRSRTVNLPISGAASDGEVRFVVRVDPLDSVLESDLANNTAIAAAPTVVAPGLTLSVSRSSIPENAEDPRIRATVTRSGSTASALPVTVESSAPGRLQVPESVLILQGSASASFDLTVLPDGIYTGDEVVEVSVSAPGFLSGAASITVIDTDVPDLELVVEPSTLVKGATATAIVSRETGLTEPLTVTLVSSHPGRLSTPPSVTIPAGESVAAFTVTAVANALFLQPRTYTLTASAPGHESASTAVSVIEPDAPPFFSFSLSADRIQEDAVNPATTGTISITAPLNYDVRFNLANSHPDRVQVPGFVTLFRGTTRVDFDIHAIDNDIIDGNALVTLTAAVADSLTGLVFPGTEAEALLEVIDDDGPRLRLVFDSAVAPMGASVNATVSRNDGLDTDLQVDLFSDAAGAVSLPVSVTIPAGAESVSFAIETLAGAVQDGRLDVRLTATAAGFADGEAVLVVTDLQLPDLVVAAVSVTPQVLTGEVFQVTYRIENRGLAPATGSWEQQILRSDDPFPGEDLPLGAFRFTGTLPPGQYYERTVSFFAPQQAGEYWIVVRTDAGGEIEELIETNNAAVSTAPLVVDDAYTAVVTAGIDTAPAGTPVPLSGTATRAGGGPAASVIVNLHIFVRDTHRV